MSTKERLKSGLIPIAKIAPSELVEMHALFVQYYANVPFETFIRDLNKKQAVFMLKGKQTNAIRGFSTITELELQYKGKPAVGVFSGDTVMHREWWGQTTLHKPFFAYMIKLRFSKPLTPIFWLLISKGYKTYLLMANNFDDYYPRVDKASQPHFEKLVESYCDQLWPGVYNRQTKLLQFGENSARLKDHVTPITDKLRDGVPKIRYFEKCNPTWMDGTELPCVAAVTFINAVTYGKKFVRKLLGLNKSQSLVLSQTAAHPRSGK